MANPLLEALMGGYGGEADYLTKDPFFSAGRSAANWQYQPQTSSEALWMPALQGLLSGALTGYGKKSAKETAFDEYKASPILKMLQGGEDPLHDYSSEDAPEGWTPKIGKSDLLFQALREEKKMEAEAKAEERRADLEKLLTGKGMSMLPTGQITKIPGFGETQAQFAAQEAAEKKFADLKAEGDFLGYNPKKEEEVEKLRKEFSALPEVKDFSHVARSADAMAGALKDSNAVTDLELSRYSILLIEPQMAVREGEQKAVFNSASVPDQWKASIDKALTGKSQLPPEIREGLRNLALRAYKAQKTSYDKAVEHYSREATIKNIDPERLFYLGDSVEPETLLPPLKTSSVPPGMQLFRSKKTGETKLVPK